MKIIAMPCSESLRSAAMRTVASLSARTAVGSSRTSSLVLLLSISRAISVNCLCPTGISLISVSALRSTPSVLMAFSALARMSALSRVLSRSPKTSTVKLYFVDSLLSRMFSVALKPGMSENSWCTIPIPAWRASSGSLKWTSSPSIFIFPS